MSNVNKKYFTNDTDYTTNSPSYYESLARFTSTLRLLTERLDDVELHFKEMLLEWLADGTLTGILEQALLDKYATKEHVKQAIDDLNMSQYTTIEFLHEVIKDYDEIIMERFNNHIKDFEQLKTFFENSLQRVSIKSLGAKGDGVNDDSIAFQQALDMAKGRDKSVRIYIPEGTYILKNELNIYSNTDILATNNTTLIRKHNGYMLLNGDRGANYWGYDGQKNLTISGGVWDSNGKSHSMATGFALGHAENIVIKDLSILNIRSSHAIELNACRNVTVKQCEFKGFIDTDENRRFSEAIQLDIMKNSGVFNAFGQYDSTPCKNITIENNYFGRSDTTGYWGRGVGSHTATATKQQREINIINNVFDNILDWAVRSYNWEHVVIDGNKMLNCGKGVNLRASITGVYTEDETGEQIGSEELAGYALTNNHFVGGITKGRCIEAYGEKDTYGRIRNVTIQGNYINPARASSKFLIYIYYAKSVNIIGNTLRNSGAESIAINKNSLDVNIIGNTISNSARSGIRVYAGSIGINIGNNTIRKSGYNGIHVTGKSEYITINNNTIIGANGARDNTDMYNHIRVTEDSKNFTITGNVIRFYSTSYTGKTGIYVTSTCKDVVTGLNNLVGFELTNNSTTTSKKSVNGDIYE